MVLTSLAALLLRARRQAADRVRIGFAESLPRRLLAHSKNATDLLPSDAVFTRCRDEGGNPRVDSLRLALESLALFERFTESREDVVLLGEHVELLLKIRHESSVPRLSRMPDGSSCVLTNRQEALTTAYSPMNPRRDPAAQRALLQRYRAPEVRTQPPSVSWRPFKLHACGNPAGGHDARFDQSNTTVALVANLETRPIDIRAKGELTTSGEPVVAEALAQRDAARRRSDRGDTSPERVRLGGVGGSACPTSSRAHLRAADPIVTGRRHRPVTIASAGPAGPRVGLHHAA